MNKPIVKLLGEDGNVFAIIGAVSQGLRRAGLSKQAEDFQEKAKNSESYDAVLALVSSYVEVE